MRRSIALFAAALAAAVLVYAPSLDGQFQFDDWTSVQTNWAIRDPGRVLSGMRAVELLGPERPVTNLTFALDYALAGLDPFAFRLTTLVVHLAAAVLAFAFARQALRRIGHPRADLLAAVAAGAFVLHPLQSGAVCYVAQRSELLSSALYLASLLLFLRALDRWGRASAWAWAAAATASATLALGAKAIAVTLPVALLLHALTVGVGPGRAPLRARLGRAALVSAPAWALALGSIARNLVVLGPEQTAGLFTGVGPWRYFLTQLEVHWWYARLLVWPAGQNVDPDFPASASVPGLEVAAAFFATLGALALVTWLVHRASQEPAAHGGAERVVAFGVFWWYLLLAPTSSIVPLADLAAEHRAYLASLGALLALVVAADALIVRHLARRRRALAVAALVLVWGGLAGASAARARVWRTELSLWEDAARKAPGNPRAVRNLAYALLKAGRYQEAERHFLRAQALARTPADVGRAARNLAGMYLMLGWLDRALSTADLGIAALPWNHELRLERAICLTRMGRLDEAYAESLRAVSMAPGDPGANDALGVVLLQLSQWERALEAFRTARAIDAGNALYLAHEFSALAGLGRAAEACAAWSTLVARGMHDAGMRARAERLGCR